MTNTIPTNTIPMTNIVPANTMPTNSIATHLHLMFNNQNTLWITALRKLLPLLAGAVVKHRTKLPGCLVEAKYE